HRYECCGWSRLAIPIDSNIGGDAHVSGLVLLGIEAVGGHTHPAVVQPATSALTPADDVAPVIVAPVLPADEQPSGDTKEGEEDGRPDGQRADIDGDHGREISRARS